MEHIIKTMKPNEMIEITDMIKQDLQNSKITEGTVTVFIPHTTAGITINENADSDVKHDILNTLEKLFPKRGEYRHREGNSDAHLKASVMGSSVAVIIENGSMKLGTWQGIYFCEFDGPRTRKFYVKIMQG